jgi:hypothetical protein
MPIEPCDAGPSADHRTDTDVEAPQAAATAADHRGRPASRPAHTRTRLAEAQIRAGDKTNTAAHRGSCRYNRRSSTG